MFMFFKYIEWGAGLLIVVALALVALGLLRSDLKNRAEAFGIAGPSAPEKVEGLAFGPDLADGRHLLVVTTDNDFVPTQPSLFFAFGVDASDLPGFVPQHLDPLCAPSPLAGAAPQ